MVNEKQKIDATILIDFPILKRIVNASPLVYLDNSASTHIPLSVIEKITNFQNSQYANVHRGVHTLSQEASALYDGTRSTIKDFIHAPSAKNIVFTSGTTESINLVAYSYGLSQLKDGDEIIIDAMSHHANIVPWQLIQNYKNIKINVIPLLENGDLDIEAYKEMLNARTKIVSITHVSNVLGTINPVKEMTQLAHEHNAIVLIDGAQAIAHLPVDVQDINCDFYAFSGHKIYSSNGTGVLYGKSTLLENMVPFKGGGDMILSVDFHETVFNEVPYKFEAGTPNITGFIGLSESINWFRRFDIDEIIAHEKHLTEYALKKLKGIDSVHIIGNTSNRIGVIAFTFDGVHAHDIGTLLDDQGIAVRVGHHCAQPLHKLLNIPSTIRISFGIYSTENDIDRLYEGLLRIKEVFKS